MIVVVMMVQCWCFMHMGRADIAGCVIKMLRSYHRSLRIDTHQMLYYY